MKAYESIYSCVKGDHKNCKILEFKEQKVKKIRIFDYKIFNIKNINF